VTVRRTDTGGIVLTGSCAVEDAEPLLQMLQANPAAPVDWTECRHVHSAVYQVLLAAGSVPSHPCRDGWIQQWLAPTLR
jgi:hypothetical protein